jgi:mannose-6-phosphate isomerase-like protein (cupin superfamily)
MAELNKRPWGGYYVLAEDAQAVKILVVKPMFRLSLQTHAKRSERWTPMTDGMMAIIGEDAIILEKFKTYIVDVGMVHRIMNYGDTDGYIIETMHGEYDEEDIVRLSDDFGRSL